MIGRRIAAVRSIFIVLSIIRERLKYPVDIAMGLRSPHAYF